MMHRAIIGIMASSKPSTRPLDGKSNVAAAFALFKLKSDYAGSCVRTRRSTDNTEQNIGFNGNGLDVAAISAFCGAGNGFIVTWYDQSGNGKNYTQTNATKQPKIYESGALLVDGNNKPKIVFDHSDDLIVCTDTAFELNQPLTSLWVGKDATGGNIAYGSTSFGSHYAQTVSNTSIQAFAGINQPQSINATVPHVVSIVWDGASSLFKHNGNSAVTINPSTNGTGINQAIGAGGGSSSAYNWGDYLQAVILFSEAKDASELSVLHNAINTELSIY